MSAAETTGVQLVTLTINGREVQAQPGQTILEVACAAGIEIPTLCHDPRLEPYGACRMCLVEVEGARGPMAACGTAVKEGMKIQTHSPRVILARGPSGLKCVNGDIGKGPSMDGSLRTGCIRPGAFQQGLPRMTTVGRPQHEYRTGPSRTHGNVQIIHLRPPGPASALLTRSGRTGILFFP